MYLPDVNVWLAAAWAGHARHLRVKEWFDDNTQPLAFCRVTQMSLLRLVTNPAVLGPDATRRSSAWQLLDQLLTDPRVTWTDEPRELEGIWRTMSARDDQSHELWTDDHLAAFAQAGRLTLVTLDQPLRRRHPSAHIEVLITR